MVDELLTAENLTILGVLFGLLMCSGLIINVITEACRPTDSSKGEDR